MLDLIAMKWPDMAAEINLWLKTQRIVETTTHDITAVKVM